MQVSAAVIEVAKTALDEAHLVEAIYPAPSENGVRLRIDSFALTANNVTYAQVAERLGYWTLFPASAGRGIVPVWGHATVEQSRCSEVAVGERWFGLLPMATHLDIVAGAVSAGSVTDIAPHRAAMSPFYNRYARLGVGPSPAVLRDRFRETFQPLFATGYLIEQVLREADWHGAENLVVTSASSKTALALAFQVARSSRAVTRVGVTSARNRDYVLGTGLFDKVLTYDQSDTLDRLPSVLVDFAGDAGLRRAIHARLGDSLKYSCSVGATHVGGPASVSASPLPGPAPEFFFAPTELERVATRQGAEVFQRGLADALRDFATDAVGLVAFDVRSGLAAARAAYLATLAGQSAPADAIIIRP